MPRRKKPNDYGTGIPYHEVEALARVLLLEIQAFFENEWILSEQFRLIVDYDEHERVESVKVVPST